ncbi:hypothetical protein ACK36U_20485, partial [Aeromonas veronii]
GYHQSAVGHLSPFIHECRTYYLNSRSNDIAISNETCRASSNKFSRNQSPFAVATPTSYALSMLN